MPRAQAILTGENISLETRERDIHDCFYQLGTVDRIVSVETLTDFMFNGGTKIVPAVRITAEVTPHPDDAIRWYRKDEFRDSLMGRNRENNASYLVHRYCDKSDEGWWKAIFERAYPHKEVLYHGPDRDEAILACERHHQAAS